MDTHRVVIVGSGPAGYTAALYASRAALAPVIISGPEVGGQLMTTTDVENYPGFPEGIQGPELMDRMKKQAERFGTTFIAGRVTAVDVSSRPYKLTVEGKTEVLAQTIILATGASALYLNIPSETKLRGRGISACATCDGYFFKGKDVAVIGAGDTAMEETLYLSKICKSVVVLVRKPKEGMRASEIMKERALAQPNVSFHFETEVDEFVGEAFLTSVRVRNNVTNVKEEIVVQGAFIAIGHKPNSDVFKTILPVDEKGYIHPKDANVSTETVIPGVFVAGDINDFRYRQAVTAAGEGCRAALDAERHLETLT